MEKRYLLGITIGPVQEYIIESRKLIDLCNSSRILSQIMINIINYIKESDKSSINVYPCPKFEIVSTKHIDCSNFIIFAVGENVFSQLKRNNIEENVYGKLFDEMNTLFKERLTKQEFIQAFKQNFFLFWGAEEYEDKENYEKAYDNLITLMSNLKNTYEFDNNYDQGDISQHNNKKCSICGKKNIVSVLDDNTRIRYKLSSNENLCKFCLSKRLYNNESMESVYSVSISQWKEDNKEALKDVDELLKHVFDKNTDKYYSIERLGVKLKYINRFNNVAKEKILEKIKEDINLNNKRYEHINYGNINQNFEGIKSCLKNLQNDLKELIEKFQLVYQKNGIDKPSYEYCFIQFDVDNLGKWMSGKYLDSDKVATLMAFQTDLSKNLCEFGADLREELLKTNCKVIYSGGDDFLGILPVEDIKVVLDTIDEKFNINIRSKNELFKNITYSTSITIAPCTEPMSYVLNKTRKSLEQVKEKFEEIDSPIKNAITINYLINGMKEVSVYLKRDRLDNLFLLSNKLYEITHSEIKSELISSSYIDELERIMNNFQYEDLSYFEYRETLKVIRAELKRLINRKAKINPNEKGLLSDYVDDIFIISDTIINDNSDTNIHYIDFNNIINFFKIQYLFSKIKMKGDK